MNPFALANDKDNKIKLVIDKKMFEAKSLTFHPMQNDALTELSTEDFKKFLQNIGKVPIIVDFSQLKKGIAQLFDSSCRSRNHAEDHRRREESRQEGSKEAKRKEGREERS